MPLQVQAVSPRLRVWETRACTSQALGSGLIQALPLLCGQVRMAHPLSGPVSSSPKSGGGQADFQGSFLAVDFSEL